MLRSERWFCPNPFPRPSILSKAGYVSEDTPLANTQEAVSAGKEKYGA